MEAARKLHGRPGTACRKRVEFRAPLEHEFRPSPDAARHDACGKSFLLSPQLRVLGGQLYLFCGPHGPIDAV